MGREEEALAVLRQALQRLPEGDVQRRAICWNSIGVLLSQLRRYAEADAAYDEAGRLAPTLTDTLHNRARNAGAWAAAEDTAGRREAARKQVDAGLFYIRWALLLSRGNPTYSEIEQALERYQEELRGQR